jgi:hypothetical protein
MSSPAVLAFAWAVVRFFEGYLERIDQDRRDIHTLIVALEGTEGNVNLVLHGLAVLWLRNVFFWVQIEYQYYELWYIWACLYVLHFDPNAKEDNDDDDDNECGSGGVGGALDTKMKEYGIPRLEARVSVFSGATLKHRSQLA